MPPAFITVGRSPVAGTAHLRVAGLLIAIALLYCTEHTPPFGRQMHAVGDSERVAFLAGIRTSRTKTLACGPAGLMAAIGARFQFGSAGLTPLSGRWTEKEEFDDHHGKHRDCAMGHADQL